MSKISPIGPSPDGKGAEILVSGIIIAIIAVCVLLLPPPPKDIAVSVPSTVPLLASGSTKIQPEQIEWSRLRIILHGDPGEMEEGDLFYFMGPDTPATFTAQKSGRYYVNPGSDGQFVIGLIKEEKEK